MKLKNAKKVAVAQQVLAYAKTTGFDDAYLVLLRRGRHLFESVEDVAKEHLAGEVTVSIHLILDEELSFLIEGGRGHRRTGTQDHLRLVIELSIDLPAAHPPEPKGAALRPLLTPCRRTVITSSCSTIARWRCSPDARRRAATGS